MDVPPPVHGGRAGTYRSVVDATPYRLVLIVRVRESIVQVQCKLCRFFSFHLQNLAHDCVDARDRQLSSTHTIVVRRPDRICSSAASRSDQSELRLVLGNLRGGTAKREHHAGCCCCDFPDMVNKTASMTHC